MHPGEVGPEVELGRTKISMKGYLGTIFVTASIRTIIFYFILAAKDERIAVMGERIALLEKQNETLSKVGAVPEAVEGLKLSFDDLETKLTPILAMVKVDPLTGLVSVGNSLVNAPSQQNEKMKQAERYVEENKFDLALKKADEMEVILPGFAGSTYIRYWVSRRKGYNDDAETYAWELIEKLSEDRRIRVVYMFLVNHYLSSGKKKEAEKIHIRALELWPEDDNLRESFRRVFGYLPSVTESSP